MINLIDVTPKNSAKNLLEDIYLPEHVFCKLNNNLTITVVLQKFLKSRVKKCPNLMVS